MAITCAIALGALAPETASAQVAREPMRFGVQLNYGNDSEFGFGGRIRHSLANLFPAAPLSGIASIDMFFPGQSINWVEANYNVVYNFRPASAPRVTPYAGGGLNFVFVDFPGGSDTRLGLNILGGMEFRSSGSRVTPFVELRAIIEGGEQLVLTGGIKF